MEGNLVNLEIRTAVRRSKAVLNKIGPYTENSRFEKNTPINGVVKFGVVKEVADNLMKTLAVFETDKKTMTVPKHLKASVRQQPNTIVDVICIVKYGREKTLVVKGQKLGVPIKAEEDKKANRKVGKITFAFQTPTPKIAHSLAGLINTHEKIERIGPGK